MPRGKDKRVQVLVGTRKGESVFTSALRRRSWKDKLPDLGQCVHNLARAPGKPDRSRDAGRHWSKQGRGLPSRDAHVLVLREAFSTGDYDPTGLYFGTETGQLFYSSNKGSQWRLLANFLPPILSVETTLV